MQQCQEIQPKCAIFFQPPLFFENSTDFLKKKKGFSKFPYSKIFLASKINSRWVTGTKHYFFKLIFFYFNIQYTHFKSRNSTVVKLNWPIRLDSTKKKEEYYLHVSNSAWQLTGIETLARRGDWKGRAVDEE